MSEVLIYVVASLHVIFFVLESLLWTSPQVRRAFKITAEEAETTKVLALNQGGYNLGVALMLLWFQHTGNTQGVTVTLVFLASMGVLGALTANWRILLFQAIPALLAFGLL